MTSALPSYAHVFQDGEPEKHWLKLRTYDKLSIILAKFWGKDVREEKHKWQETQTRVHKMDTDDAPANFAFSFNIEGLNIPSMWVREDYVLLYDECTTYFANPVEKKFGSLSPSVVITGQSGIGK
jgi:hypothetical protein